MKKEKLTEADKFTKAINNAIEESEFENYERGLWDKWIRTETQRIAKEIDKEIMDLGEVYITIKVKKVDLPDNFVKTMEDGVKIVEELKESKREIERQANEIKEVRWQACLDRRDIRELIYQLKETNKELMKAKIQVQKLEGDLEYAKCSGWINRFVYPITEIEYPVMTYSNINPLAGEAVTIDNLFKTLS